MPWQASRPALQAQLPRRQGPVQVPALTSQPGDPHRVAVGPQEGVLLIGAAVAVVVLAVTDLGPGYARAHADQGAVDAHPGALPALAGAARHAAAGPAAVAGDAVDGAVAVVVPAVADLDARVGACSGTRIRPARPG